MNHLNYLWALLGANSGQLQTLLAVIGLIFAVIAALYAKKQIKLSQDQRLFELKLQLLNTSHEYLQLILTLRHKQNIYKTMFYRKFNLKGSDLMIGENYTNDHYFEKIASLLISPEDLLNKIIKSIKDNNSKLSIRDLEKYLSIICDVGNSLRHSSAAMDQRTLELEDLNLFHNTWNTNQSKYPHN
ncbi:TPA: hypothetical protein ACGE3P_000668 [Acinetobacter baumannii]|uniref:hypothetical protein n=1 Tax=Acinetobacter calcoaceticus/baumannii complex TaxID=909768 RepID=UPI0007B197D0|nr:MULTISPECIES: hypothetical protein [Acinetobacter calcoaceticus/baumannii complex]KZM60315.1 hypothetical protein AZF02_16460 [Acinetobacter baumannii]MBF9199768.1 hypothetical protein [Acinetobacter baumannii]MBJ8488147.1 hypothetical protein [Acinetobacter pittii]MCQ4750817.1 hypothetical protein [Acinetobacter baumannii]MCQ9999145.1 hypothetical protein [Acinetobacter baumannii]